MRRHFLLLALILAVARPARSQYGDIGEADYGGGGGVPTWLKNINRGGGSKKRMIFFMSNNKVPFLDVFRPLVDRAQASGLRK
jgi:hypothetical protein